MRGDVSQRETAIASAVKPMASNGDLVGSRGKIVSLVGLGAEIFEPAEMCGPFKLL